MHQKGSFLISTDKVRLDLGAIHSFLTTSYWAKGIPMEVVRRAIQNSLCFGLYEADPKSVSRELFQIMQPMLICAMCTFLNLTEGEVWRNG